MIIHPYLNEKVEIGLLPYVQAMLMARYIRQDIDDYPGISYKMIFLNYVHSCDLRCGYYKQRGGLAVYDVWPRHVLDYGQRVQNSVFECVVTEAQYSLFKRES